MRPRALACPASLKGVASAVEAAEAIVRGLRHAGVDAEALPVGDGGEGTAEALQRELGGEWRTATVSDALGRPVEASFLLLPDRTAVVESSEPLGLPRLEPGERDPLHATSRGLGELIVAALVERPASLLVCLGGTATVDGGAGLLEVLDHLPAPARVLCDVATRLYDAPRLYGPQKGATPRQVALLEARLRRMAKLAPYAELPGSGAAGGLGAAFAALGAELVPGAEAVLDLLEFDPRPYALVVTGEGTVDRTTAEGKAPGAVARRCSKAGVRCVVFGGRVVEPLPDVETVALSGDPARAEADLVALGESLALTLLGGA